MNHGAVVIRLQPAQADVLYHAPAMERDGWGHVFSRQLDRRCNALPRLQRIVSDKVPEPVSHLDRRGSALHLIDIKAYFLYNIHNTNHRFVL